MIIYYDRYGKIQKVLTHGVPARKSTTGFEVYAYFDGINEGSVATLRLRNPNDVEFPTEAISSDLSNYTFELVDNETAESVEPFEPGKVYPVYKFTGIQLDLVGMWRGTIVINNDELLGLVSIPVDDAVGPIDSTITYDQYLQIINLLNERQDLKLNIKNGEGENSIQQKPSSKGFEFDNPNYTLPEAVGTTEGAFGKDSSMLGGNSIAYGEMSHAEGRSSVSVGIRSHAEGTKTASVGSNSHSEGLQTVAKGDNSHAEGAKTYSLGNQSHAEGDNTVASGNQSHAEGQNTLASGYSAHAEGERTQAKANGAHSEGADTIAEGYTSHAEGNKTQAGIITTKHGWIEYTNQDHIEKVITTTGTVNVVSIYVEDKTITADSHVTVVSGSQKKISVFFNRQPTAKTLVKVDYTISGVAPGPTPEPTNYEPNMCNHAEGYDTEAYLLGAHAEGQSSSAIGYASHAEGYDTLALGHRSHTEGNKTKAYGTNSHASGDNTIAGYANQFVLGTYNLNDSNNILEVGNGDSTTRKNALWVDKSGKVYASKDATDNSGLVRYGQFANKTSSIEADLDALAENVANNYVPNTALSNYSTAIALTSPHGTDVVQGNCTTNQYYQVALGYLTEVTGQEAVGIGVNNIVKGRRNFAIGSRLTIDNTNWGAIALGVFNANTSGTMLVVGNGSDENNRSNAFEVYKDGHAKVGKAINGESDLTVATKGYVDNYISSKVTAVYKFKGTVATYSELPSENLTVGDVYDVQETGDNYAWTGSTWDKLGGTVDLSSYATNKSVSDSASATLSEANGYTDDEIDNALELDLTAFAW